MQVGFDISYIFLKCLSSLSRQFAKRMRIIPFECFYYFYIAGFA